MTLAVRRAADEDEPSRRDSPMFATRGGYLTLALLTAVYAHSALCQYLIGACATELEADVGLSPQGLGFALLVDFVAAKGGVNIMNKLFVKPSSATCCSGCCSS